MPVKPRMTVKGLPPAAAQGRTVKLVIRPKRPPALPILQAPALIFPPSGMPPPLVGKCPQASTVVAWIRCTRLEMGKAGIQVTHTRHTARAANKCEVAPAPSNTDG